MGQWLIEDLSVSDVHFQPWMLLVTRHDQSAGVSDQLQRRRSCRQDHSGALGMRAMSAPTSSRHSLPICSSSKPSRRHPNSPILIVELLGLSSMDAIKVLVQVRDVNLFGGRRRSYSRATRRGASR